MADAQSDASPLSSHYRAHEHEHEHERDLGFGAVVGRESRQRLLNADGSFNVTRSGLGLLETIAPYQQLLTMPWTAFLGALALIYFAFNLLFAVAFVACGRDALLGPGSDMLGGLFSRAFFFSVQTFATIGYGQIGPNGFGPNALVTIEALVGLMFQALATGLLFARFSRPTASILFSRSALIAPYNDGRSLQFRIANRRKNQIIQLEAQVLFSLMEPDGRGGSVRRYHALPLERSKVTFFPLAWTVVHPITDSSPLRDKTTSDLERAEAEILVLLTGIDDTFAQTVHTRSSYRAEDLVWNARFISIFERGDNGSRLRADISKLHDHEPA
ncbi:MAG: ion channel [Vicinamibacterales bacterium]